MEIKTTVEIYNLDYKWNEVKWVKLNEMKANLELYRKDYPDLIDILISGLNDKVNEK
jgi:hypothetical protein